MRNTALWYRAAQKEVLALKKELIHSRNITVNCYETDEGRLLVEGTLTDERFFPYLIHALQETREPGLIHRMVVTMELTVPGLQILSVKVDMPVVPDPGCREIRESLKKLEGLSIRPGFTLEVRALFGKAAGCLHLTQLLLAMSSAAVQGLWTYGSRLRGEERPGFPDIDGSLLIDSCHMWRKDGPFPERFRRAKASLADGKR